jgi:uncharacterized protein YodC (DUF2158 family)
MECFMELKDFAVGQLVKLKSGGPIMTVKEISGAAMLGEESVTCIWNDKNGLNTEGFLPLTLEIASKNFTPPKVNRGRLGGK